MRSHHSSLIGNSGVRANNLDKWNCKTLTKRHVSASWTFVFVQRADNSCSLTWEVNACGVSNAELINSCRKALIAYELRLKEGHTNVRGTPEHLSYAHVHGAGTPIVVGNLVIANFELGWDIEG